MGLQEGLAKGGCLLCQALRTSLRRYIFSFLYEGMMSGIAREEFLKGGGFCQPHFWEANAIEEECWAEGFGISILCENLLDGSLKDLEAWTGNGNRGKPGLLRFRRPTRKRDRNFSFIPGNRCIACAMLQSSEEHYLKSLEELLEGPEFGGRFQHSQGLCLHHLQAAFDSWESPVALELIKTTALKFVRKTIAELREFQRKHDYQHKHEPRGSEWSSPERAIEFLVGTTAELSALEELRRTLGMRQVGRHPRPHRSYLRFTHRL